LEINWIWYRCNLVEISDIATCIYFVLDASIVSQLIFPHVNVVFI